MRDIPARCRCGYPLPCPEHPAVSAPSPGGRIRVDFGRVVPLGSAGADGQTASGHRGAIQRLVEIESKVLKINRELIAERDAAEAERDCAQKAAAAATAERDSARLFLKDAEERATGAAAASEQARRALVVATEWEKKAVQLEQELVATRSEREALRAEVRAEKKRADAAHADTTRCCLDEKSGCGSALRLRKTHDDALMWAATAEAMAAEAQAATEAETRRANEAEKRGAGRCCLGCKAGETIDSLRKQRSDAITRADAAEARAAAAAVRRDEACVAAGDAFNRGVAKGRELERRRLSGAGKFWTRLTCSACGAQLDPTVNHFCVSLGGGLW